MTPRQAAQAKNHPAKGDIITSKPIVDRAALQRIKDNLKDHPRNYALLIVGINTAFRAGDLLKLKVGDVRGEKILIREEKRGKVREFYINRAVRLAVAPLIQGKADSDWLFPSARSGKPLLVPVFSSMVKIWAFAAGLGSDGYSSHSLRKSWSRFQYDSGEPLCKISEALGHSSERITRIYIGLQPEEMKSMYMREL